LDFDNNIESEEDPFIVCYKLSKHVGRVKSMMQMKNGYLITGGSEMASKKDNSIMVWKPNDLDGFFHVQTLNGHKSDINGLIELKDGRILSSSKDRTLRIWKSFVKQDKNKENEIQFQIDEILNEYKHGIYLILQIKDGRIFSSTSEGALVVWKDNKYLTFC
jgi:WD40 repeat protein